MTRPQQYRYHAAFIAVRDSSNTAAGGVRQGASGCARASMNKWRCLGCRAESAGHYRPLLTSRDPSHEPMRATTRATASPPAQLSVRSREAVARPVQGQERQELARHREPRRVSNVHPICQELPGQHLFRYLTRTATRWAHHVDRRHDICSIDGARSGKGFPHLVCHSAGEPAARSRKARQRDRAIARSARHCIRWRRGSGNTIAICANATSIPAAGSFHAAAALRPLGPTQCVAPGEAATLRFLRRRLKA